MAASDNSQSQGYQCEFIDSVPEDLLCKKCSLVARKLTITNCCGESYCHACIADTQQQPCPECGEQFTIYEQMKYQRRIKGLQVHCSMRGRGCDWSGTLDQLYTHLDPDCQYVDTKCPLNCQLLIPKNKVKQHVAEECTKRDYVCKHCTFKSTYKEVMGTHLAECIYFPLQCPNFCGVTYERHAMEDHRSICLLEEVKVECDGTSRREDQEEHVRQSNQINLVSIAATAVKLNQQLQWTVQRQDKLLQEKDKKLQQQETKLRQQQQTLKEREWKLQERDKELQDKEKIIQQQNYDIKNLKWKLS